MMQTFTPTEYLKIDIAGNFGHDKISWDDRIAWFNENEAQLESLNKDAKEPALYFAGVQAWRQTQRGEPTGYPISLDATSSGAQLLAIMISCEKSARLCNVIDTGNREDFYRNIYWIMLDELGEDAKLAHGDVKKAIMTSLYGSTAVPKRVFGEGALYECFIRTMEKAAPGIWELNKALLELWNPKAFSHSWVLPDNFHVHTKTIAKRVATVHFENGNYEVPVHLNQPTQEGLSIPANITHSIDGFIVREMERRCSHDPKQVLAAMDHLTGIGHTVEKGNTHSYNCRMVKKLARHHQQSGFLSARILDFIDEDSINFAPQKALENLLYSLPKKPFNVLAVHDCFRVHPNNGNALREQYNQILHELAESNMLSYLASQLTGQNIKVTKYADLTACGDGILQANYALS